MKTEPVKKSRTMPNNIFLFADKSILERKCYGSLFRILFKKTDQHENSVQKNREMDEKTIGKKFVSKF